MQVQRTLRLRGRKYFVTASLGGSGGSPSGIPAQTRLQVYDPAGRTLRVVHELPDMLSARQTIDSLRRLDRQGCCVPSLLDCERSKDGWRLLTSWVEGQSLSAYLQSARDGKKPWPSVHETVRLYRRFVHGLCQFHQFTGGVHGDISPANLIVQAQPHALVLIDYGSAWPVYDASARSNGDGATPGYSAPERMGETVVNVLADQFSASVVFYEMLTGQLPYEGMGGRAGEPTHREAFADAYCSPSQRADQRSNFPRGAWDAIDALAAKGLKLVPAERYQNSGQWRDAANAAWEAVRLPARASTTARIGEAIAAWIERLTKKKT